MTEDEVLRIALVESQSANMSAAAGFVLESELSVEIKAQMTIDEAFASLESADIDLVLIPASDITQDPRIGDSFACAAALPLRDWNSVLVCEDRLNHLPRGAIVLAHSRLTRRQMRRYRPDARIRSATAHCGIEGIEIPEEVGKGNLEAFTEWANALRLAGDIDAFVIPRHIFSSVGLKARRHALSDDPAEDELLRFLPAPHSGAVLLVGRIGFPKGMISAINDEEAFTSWEVTETFLSGLEEKDSSSLGIRVRHKTPATLLREAERRRDLLTQNSLKDTEGELVGLDTKVEIQIEYVGHLGKRSLSMERIGNISDSGVITRFTSQEWNRLVRGSSKEDGFVDHQSV